MKSIPLYFSQEIIRCSFADIWFSLSRCWIKLQAILESMSHKYLQCIFHKLIYFHYCCFISTSVAIVWSWEHSHYVTFMRPIVSIHNKLMSSWDQLQIVCMVKLFGNVLTKWVTSTSRWDTPTASIIWIWPQQIANWSTRKGYAYLSEKLTLHGALLALCQAV